MRNGEASYLPGAELRHDWIEMLLIAGMFAIGLIALPHLPAQIAVHFGLNGKPNGWASSWTAILQMPTIALGLWLLLIFMPVIDPRRRNYSTFLGFYRSMRLLLVLFLFLMNFTTIWRGLGHPVNVSVLSTGVLCALFLFMGNYLGRVRPNWFVGIRTPWTLSNDEVWRRTHRFGSRLMMLGALPPLIALVFSSTLALGLLVVCVVATSLAIVIYSYLVFRRIAS